jgi:hypothetical protein
MATGEIRKAAANAGSDGAAAPQRLLGEGSGVSNDWLTAAALEGKVFVSGIGLEGTATTGRTSKAETTPDIMLQSPSGGGVIVVPLYFKALMTAEGGAAPDWFISYVQADASPTTVGTTVTPLSLQGPNGPDSGATLQTAPTAAAFTSLQNVRLDGGENTLDNLISVEGATTVILANDLQNNQTTIEWKAPVPMFMKDGASLMIHFVTGTTGSQYEWTLYHAELDASAYGV